jgi:hypothetical protein
MRASRGASMLRYQGPRSVRARHRPSTLADRDRTVIPIGRPRAHCSPTPRRGEPGLSGRRPRTSERTSIPTAVGRGRSRSRVTNRATMSDRPRAWNASGGTHRRSSSRSPPEASGGRSSFSGRKKEERRATAAVPVNRLRGPVHVFRVHGASTRYGLPGHARAIGKAPHPRRRVTAAADSARLYSPRPGLRVEAVRSGEVLRSRDQGASSVP